LELFEYFDAHAKQGTRQFIDFIVMDINMPTMNGISALSKIKRDSLLKKIPIFMLSTTREDSAYAECLNLGAVAFSQNLITVTNLKEFSVVCLRLLKPTKL